VARYRGWAGTRINQGLLRQLAAESCALEIRRERRLLHAMPDELPKDVGVYRSDIDGLAELIVRRGGRAASPDEGTTLPCFRGFEPGARDLVPPELTRVRRSVTIKER
jgi:hypothetical protein